MSKIRGDSNKISELEDTMKRVIQYCRNMLDSIVCDTTIQDPLMHLNLKSLENGFATVENIFEQTQMMDCNERTREIQKDIIGTFKSSNFSHNDDKFSQPDFTNNKISLVEENKENQREANKSVVVISSQEEENSSINEGLSQEESVKLEITKKTTDFAGNKRFNVSNDLNKTEEDCSLDSFKIYNKTICFYCKNCITNYDYISASCGHKIHVFCMMKRISESLNVLSYRINCRTNTCIGTISLDMIRPFMINQKERALFEF